MRPLVHLLIGAPLKATPFLKVIGTGIIPVGFECQAQVPPGIPGYQKVHAFSDPVTLGPNGGGSVTAQCPVGKKVLGGGGLESTELVTIVRSYPPTDTSWTVLLRNQTLVFKREVDDILLKSVNNLTRSSPAGMAHIGIPVRCSVVFGMLHSVRSRL